MATRRKSGARRGQSGLPGWIWLLAGILIGLGLAWYLFGKGIIPQPQPQAPQEASTSDPDAPANAEEVAPRGKDSERQKYDFFTVLPEMEVVVPEQELSGQAQPEPAGTPADGDLYQALPSAALHGPRRKPRRRATNG